MVSALGDTGLGVHLELLVGFWGDPWSSACPDPQCWAGQGSGATPGLCQHKELLVGKSMRQCPP